MFYDADQFSFTQTLEQHWHIILDECLALPGSEFDAWPETFLYNRGWDTYGLIVDRKRVMENCVFCVRTVGLLETIPGLVNAGFSRLAAGTTIGPHVGYTDAVLRLHLALRSSELCGIRVGDETRRWIPGQCLIFDDTVDHEAWNHGTSERLVLLVDFARPPAL